MPDSATQDIALVYDPFTPRAFLQALIATLATKKDPPEPDQRIAR
ncbi:Transcriptional regulators, LysR family [Enterobacter hormaechei]|nr:Transcriptional regulators, LysR family [Enterobacter hormaechei]